MESKCGFRKILDGSTNWENFNFKMMSMKKFKICVDTNIWMDHVWKKTGSDKSKKLLELLTSVESPHILMIPKILELELKYRFIKTKKRDYLVKEKNYKRLRYEIRDEMVSKMVYPIPDCLVYHNCCFGLGIST